MGRCEPSRSETIGFNRTKALEYQNSPSFSIYCKCANGWIRRLANGRYSGWINSFRRVIRGDLIASPQFAFRPRVEPSPTWTLFWSTMSRRDIIGLSWCISIKISPKTFIAQHNAANFAKKKKKKLSMPSRLPPQPTNPHGIYNSVFEKHQFLSYVVSDEHTTRQSHNRIRQSSSLNLLHEVETAE